MARKVESIREEMDSVVITRDAAKDRMSREGQAMRKAEKRFVELQAELIESFAAPKAAK